MKNLFEPFISHKGFVVLDGAMATELESRGANLNHELWSAKILKEDSQLIRNVHFDYLMAGADVITTASYQASFEGFTKQGYSEKEAKEFMRLSTLLAYEAREDASKIKNFKEQPLIAASVGPYGASLADGSEYRGNYGIGIEELKTFHRNRLKILIETGADIIACETIPCIDEAIALKELFVEFPTVQAWISFSCKDEEHLSSGELLSDALELLNESQQIIAVGINCTSPQYIESLIKIAAVATSKLILAYPNKGEIYDPKNKCWISGTHENSRFIDDAKRWHAAGAKIIGGCCRTTPEDIQTLQSLLK